MKKFLLVFSFLVLAFAFSANRAAAEFKVLASTFPVYLFAANVCAGVPDVSVSLLVPAAAGCPHDFALRPGDMTKLEKADALVVNGAGLEDFLVKPLQNAGGKLPVIDAAKSVTLLDGDGHGHDHGAVNPHIFSAPYEARMMVKNIADGLAKLNPENAARYAANADAYDKILANLSGKFIEIGAKADNKATVLEHDALAYLVKNAGLAIIAVFEDGASAAELTRVKKIILDKKPAALIGDSQYSDKLLQTLSRETDTPFILLNPCAGGPEDAPLDYYQKVMEENLKIMEDQFDR